MKLGRIIGTVVSTRKDASLASLKLLIVENLTTTLEREGATSWRWTASEPD